MFLNSEALVIRFFVNLTLLKNVFFIPLSYLILNRKTGVFIKCNSMKQILCIPVVCILFFSGIFSSCSDSGKKTPDFVVPIYCDEDFEPIISTEAEVFDALNSPKGITPNYANEVEAIDMLVKDSVRLTVVSRKLTEYEKKKLKDTKNLKPREILIAYDGIAIIVNKNNPDSLITIDNLKKIFTREITDWSQLDPKSKLGKIQVVFNNPTSGTVRFIKDSICQGQTLSSELKALKTNMEVLNYVTETPYAMGIIGACWISNDKDSLQLSFNNKISVMGVTKDNVATAGNVTRPYLYNLAQKNYPLMREVYLIHTDPTYGTQQSFANFVAGDRGQRIILKSGLFPALQPTRLVERTK